MSVHVWRNRYPKHAPRVYIGVDPGTTTGVAIWKRNLPDQIDLRELSHKMFRNQMKPWTRARHVCFFSERFDIGEETVRVSPPVDSLYINGWLATECGPSRYVEVGRADCKDFMSNAKLQFFDWWIRGSKDHCRDAARALAMGLSYYQEPWFEEKMTLYLETLT